MRQFSLLSVLLITTSVSAAFAQAPTTLDEQMRRLQQQKPTERKAFPVQAKTAEEETGFTISNDDATPAPTPAPTRAKANANPSSLPVSRSGEVIDSVGSGAIAPLPLEMVTENGVSYISGGISDEETDQLKAQQDDYNVRLLITGMNGEYASDVVLSLVDNKGFTFLKVEDAGPYVYLKVPVGSYELVVNDKKLPMKLTEGKPYKTQIRVGK